MLCERNPLQITFSEIIAADCNTCAHLQHVCGRGNTLHSHHRVGYDGQNQIYPTQHTLVVLGQVLPLPFDGDQDAPSGAKAKSHV